MKSAALLLLLLGAAVPLAGQASLVPANHPVYEWLHRQRVRGVIPRFEYEALPLTRGAVAALIDSVVRRGGLSRLDRSVAVSYRRELAAPSGDSIVTLTQGSARGVRAVVREKFDLLLSDDEPHLYRHVGPGGHATVDYQMGLGAFGGSEVADGLDKFEVKTLRAYGTIYERIGFHLDVQNVSGSQLFGWHPLWRSTQEVVWGNGATTWAQGFASVNYRDFGLDIGTGSLRLGAPARQGVILDAFGPGFDWVRLRFTTRLIQYTFVHGSLSSATHDTVVPGTDILTRVAPSRWVVLRRIQIRPHDRLQLGFTEALTYSNRGVELAYLNPIYPLRIAEFNTNDRDNPVWYLDAILRPMNGVEISGTLGIDDMASFADWLRPTGQRSNDDLTTKLLYAGWGSVALPTGTDVFGGYVRVEPFFYTHKFPLNAFEQRGFGLGAEVGPNGDEWTLGLRQWLPWRATVTASLSGGRQGLNPVDSVGGEAEDVGGSIASEHFGQQILFLAGDRHQTRTLRANVAVEPVRGFRVEADWQRRVVLQGTRLPEVSVLRLGASLSFYPIDVLLLII